MEIIYDTIIIGGGPAGLTAAIYALRSGMKTLLIENIIQGGQITLTEKVENYPGIKEVSGFELGNNMFEQAIDLGLDNISDEVTSLELEQKIKIIRTQDKEFRTYSIILALGTTHKKLGLENEDELLNNGIAYCSTCDGFLYNGKRVAVIGGGNSAISGALYLSSICEKVIIFNDLSELICQDTYKQQLCKLDNIEIINNSNIRQILKNGNQLDVIYNDTQVCVSGVFILIGRQPNSSLIEDTNIKMQNNYIITDENMKTTISGVFAAGDIRIKKYRQIVTACSDGAIAALEANEFVKTIKSSHIIK